MPFGLYFLLPAGKNADAMTSYPAATWTMPYLVIPRVDKEESQKEPASCQIDILYERITS